MAFHYPEMLPAGAVLDDDYRIDRLLGSGGMADVYLGRKLDLDIAAAIKVLKPIADEARRARFQRRFMTEARAAARVDHPNVVRILGYRADMELQLLDGQVARFARPYLAMSYLTGVDLETALVSHGPIEPVRAWRLMCGALAGLARGHDLGIVHKDLKPANLFLVDDRGAGDPERMCIVDFGIARVADLDDDSRTRTGETWCTPAYAAPEYIDDHSVSPALDVYQAGLVLAEMLTGAPLVQGATAFRCFAAHVQGLELPDDLARSPFSAVLERALQLEPTARYGDAGGFYQALAALDETTLAQMAPLSARPRLSDGEDTGVADPTAADTVDAVDLSATAPVVVDRPAPPERTAAVIPGANTEPTDAPREPRRRVPAIVAAAVAALCAALVVWALSSGAGEGRNETASASERPSVEETTAAPTSPPATTECGPDETRVGRLCVPAGMVFMSAGSVRLGCEPGDALCAADEAPAREVVMPAMLMDATEVTVADYRACVDAGACEVPHVADGPHYTWSMDGADDRPINGVTWAQAAAYCAFVDKRLPTEAEWEAAARGHANRRFPWGNHMLGPDSPPVANLADETASATFGWPAIVVGYDDGLDHPGPVRALAPLRSGLYSMGGNVREWVADCYVDAPDGDCPERIARGSYFGAWEEANMRSSARYHVGADHARYGIGFRCARSLAAP